MWEFLPLAALALDQAPADDGLRVLAIAALVRLGLRTPALEQLDHLSPAALASPEVAGLAALVRGLAADAVPLETREVRVRRGIEILSCRRGGVWMGPTGVTADQAETAADGAQAADGAKSTDGAKSAAAELMSRLPGWRQSAAQSLVVASKDGNYLRRPILGVGPLPGVAPSEEARASGPARRVPLSCWGPWADLAGQAERFVQTRWPVQPGFVPPVTVEGMDPPWILRALWREHRPRADGFSPRFQAVQADPLEFLDGISLAKLDELLGDERVHIYLGGGAAERLGAELLRRLDTKLSGPLIPLATVRTRAKPALSEVLPAVGRTQAERARELREQIAGVYSGRDRAWWRRRYEQALSAVSQKRAGEGLRVLVPTCRFSTYIRHASADLVDALRAGGHTAELLIEPDEQSTLSSVAYLQAVRRLEPDLIILVNYTRWHLHGGSEPGSGTERGQTETGVGTEARAAAEGVQTPASWVIHWQVPFVCWIQDAMGHLFDPAAGQGQGELDYLAGHLYPELFAAHGYPRSRALPSTVAAHDLKFYIEGPPQEASGFGARAPMPAQAKAGVASIDGEHARFRCDVAYVSHQSETPEAMHDRLRGQFADALGLRRALDELRPRIEAHVRRPVHELGALDTLRLARAALREELGAEPAERVVDLVSKGYVAAYADRFLRHQTLEWAAQAAARRGWDFGLFGAGWESHPRLGVHARGPVEHGPALRACYRLAGVHLHMTANSLVHQRLIECLLSGGTPMCRLHAPEMAGVIQRAMRLAARAGVTPDTCIRDTWVDLVSMADSPVLMELASLLGRWGLLEAMIIRSGEAVGWPFYADRYRQAGDDEIAALEAYSAVHLLGRGGELFFHDAATLEERVAWALENPGARLAVLESAMRRVRSHGGGHTLGAWARRLIEMIAEDLKSVGPVRTTAPAAVANL